MSGIRSIFRPPEALKPDIDVDDVLPDGGSTVFVVENQNDWRRELAVITDSNAGPALGPLLHSADVYRDSEWEVIGTQKEVYGEVDE